MLSCYIPIGCGTREQYLLTSISVHMTASCLCKWTKSGWSLVYVRRKGNLLPQTIFTFSRVKQKCLSFQEMINIDRLLYIDELGRFGLVDPARMRVQVGLEACTSLVMKSMKNCPSEHLILLQ